MPASIDARASASTGSAGPAPAPQGEVLHVDAEVVLRRGLHAVRAVAEVEHVQVVGEDVVLALAVLEPDRDGRLADLAAEGAVVADVDVLDVLLRDRRAALARAAGEVAVGRAQRRDRVDALVLEEAGVLGRDDRLAHDLGDVLGRAAPRGAAPAGSGRTACRPSRAAAPAWAPAGRRARRAVRPAGHRRRSSRRRRTARTQHEQGAAEQARAPRRGRAARVRVPAGHGLQRTGSWSGTVPSRLDGVPTDEEDPCRARSGCPQAAGADADVRAVLAGAASAAAAEVEDVLARPARPDRRRPSSTSTTR